MQRMAARRAGGCDGLQLELFWGRASPAETLSDLRPPSAEALAGVGARAAAERESRDANGGAAQGKVGVEETLPPPPVSRVNGVEALHVPPIAETESGLVA